MQIYTRQQLHDLVWSGPMRDVSTKLGLSDNGLRKHCVKAFVPLPPQGHWNKLQAGHKVKTTPLAATARNFGYDLDRQVGLPRE
jgi:hypothetical protein